MSVWLVDPIGYTGLAYYDAGLANALIKQGVKVTIVTSGAWLLDASATTARIRRIFRGTHSGSRLAKGMRYAVSLIRLLITAAARRPTVLHWQYHQVPILEAVAIRLLKAMGLQQVYTAHELLPWSPAAWDRRLFRLIYRSVDRVVVHRTHEAIILAERFDIPPERIAVIGHGAYEGFAAPNMDQTFARVQLGLQPSNPLALFFGSVRPSKGLDVLLDAWPSVVKRVPGAMLYVAGKPASQSIADAARAAASSRGVADAIRFDFRQMDPREANLCYAAADVVALPYKEIVASGVVRYAYSAARPVVATKVGELPSLVRDGETGILVAPGDPPALADALVSLLQDRTAAAALGLNALEYARTHLSWDSPARATVGIYREISGVPT